MQSTTATVRCTLLSTVLLAACHGTSPSSSGQGGKSGTGGLSLGGSADSATGGATSTIPGTGGVITPDATGGTVGDATIGLGGASGQGGALSSGGTTATTVATGTCDVPAEARAETTAGATVVGDGTPASCTAAAFETAVQKGGVVTFNCGPEQATITLDHQIKLLNNAGADGLGRRVIDGGNKVVLSGGLTTRLLYQDACDETLGKVNGDCMNSPSPSLAIQNLALANTTPPSDDHGGGAIYLRGGRLKVYFSSFCNNVTNQFGSQYSGGAIYAEHAYGEVYVVNSLFGGTGPCGNLSSNGGSIGGVSTSFTIINSRLTNNGANGFGGNPPADNTPGGGCGGAIYVRGNGINLTICGATITNNGAVDSAGAIYYVAGDLLGSVRIDRSLFSSNNSRYSYTPTTGRAEKGVFLQTATSNVIITASTFN
jgi:hypothetical protein